MDIQQVAAQLISYLGSDPEKIAQFALHPYSTTAKVAGTDETISQKDMSRVVAQVAAQSTGQDLGTDATKSLASALLGESGGSVRYMQTHKPPYRFVYPGRVYRNETTDAHHERAFFQYEALIVDKDITFTSGKVLIKSILSKVFGTDVPVRMRSGFFPFVEPGFEIDMQCQVCGGKGCSVCKHVGWIEVMPGGSPHPNVLRAAGLDPDEYTGFYVNIGLDRLVMMRYGVDDVRLFHSADLRFLRQFR